MIATRRPDPGRVAVLDFLVGVNPVALTTEPHDFERQSYVVVTADWNSVPSIERLELLASRLAEINPRLQLRLVGPGAQRFSSLGVRLTASRLDVWRWVSRSLCIFEPRHRLLLGQSVLEALLFGIPVVVHAGGGAAREHADLGDGGLWYRTDDEFLAAVNALLDDDLHKALGEQGRRYAEAFTDTDRFIKTVTQTFIG
jgi:glycosyltransferase involved in cell wall biosynthesis